MWAWMNYTTFGFITQNASCYAFRPGLSPPWSLAWLWKPWSLTGLGTPGLSTHRHIATLTDTPTPSLSLPTSPPCPQTTPPQMNRPYNPTNLTEGPTVKVLLCALQWFASYSPHWRCLHWLNKRNGIVDQSTLRQRWSSGVRDGVCWSLITLTTDSATIKPCTLYHRLHFHWNLLKMTEPISIQNH